MAFIVQATVALFAGRDLRSSVQVNNLVLYLIFHEPFVADNQLLMGRLLDRLLLEPKG